MGRGKYILKRLVQMVFTFWAFLTILFLLFRATPGDPTSRYVRQGMPREAQQQIIVDLGLDQPLHIQYLSYFRQLLFDFDLGTSFIYGDPVASLVWVKFWNTAFLMISSLTVAFAIGITIGALMAWYRGSRWEAVGIVLTIFTRSIPVFVMGVVFVLVFSLWLGWFPSAGMRGVGSQPEGFFETYLSQEVIWHGILPFTSAVVLYLSLPALLMRNSMLEVLSADFIKAKRAAGLTTYTIIYKHAVRNSILPIVTVAAIVGGKALGGLVLLEFVFDWPGMGRAMVDAVNSQDYPLAQGMFFIMGSIVIILNFVADILYGYLDPRVSLEGGDD